MSDANGFQSTRAGLRRSELTAAMGHLQARGAHCGACQAPCCTFERNSMKVSRQEAYDIWWHLCDGADALPEATSEALKVVVERFRLGRPEPGNGQRLFSRRFYTCPFFAQGALGCQLPPEVKPYGCLAYNPNQPGVTAGEACQSDQSLLARHAARVDRLGSELPEALGALNWESLPIPLAVLAVDVALSS